MTIAENIARIRANMAAAAREAGRDPKEILLVGASKMNDAAACREAVAAGIDALGENRVQEMVQKLEQHAYDGAPLHFIGHLQRNKVKQVVGHVALIQSVGSLELLEEIRRCMDPDEKHKLEKELQAAIYDAEDGSCLFGRVLYVNKSSMYKYDYVIDDHATEAFTACWDLSACWLNK